MSRDLPDHLSPYVFFIVFNDTSFIPINNRNETSDVNTHFHFHSLARPRGARLSAVRYVLGACGYSILAPRRIF